MKVMTPEDVSLSDLRTHIPDPLIVETEDFRAEYGIRTATGAVVIHVYPSPDVKDNQFLAAADAAVQMDPLVSEIRSGNLIATWERELRSLCLIGKDWGMAPSPYYRARKFFDFLADALAPNTTRPRVGKRT